MKRLGYLFLSLLLLAVMAFTPVSTVFAADTNLLANAGVETAAGSLPANWKADKWGTNTTTMTYKNTGHSSAKSLYINVTSYTSGDAKWVADAVTVKPNTTYVYTDYYQSNVATELDVEFTSATGTMSYGFIASVPASTSWKQVTAEFTTPADVSKLSVLHLIDRVGTLETDDFTLTEKTTTPTTPTNPTTPTTGNLIANPSMETAQTGTTALPENWLNNAWGTNDAAFSYATTGRTGTKSVTINISKYTDGDAKWYASPIAVTAGKSYTYIDYFKSDVPTHVFAAYENAAGAYSYVELASAIASGDTWMQYRTDLTVPAGAVKVTFYHVLDRVGTLSIDDVSLTETTVTPPAAGTVPNGSLEDIAGTGPAAWVSSNWGSNTATHQYMSEGRTGSKSVKVTVSNYVNGDAKWYFNPITTLTPGKAYRFTAWYKTNTTPHAVAMFTKKDGSVRYFGMPNPEPAANGASVWQKYSDTFIVPSDVVSVSALMFVSSNGWLQTDDYSFASYTPIGFNQPMVSLTFDDGEEDNVTTMLPILKQYGFKSTQCFATEHLEGGDHVTPEQAVANVQNVKKILADGHELCSHTVTHPMLSTVSATQLQYELQHSKEYLERTFARKVPNFATPYGDYNQTVNAAIMKLYGSHRTVNEGYNSKDNFDGSRIRVQNMLSTTTLAEYQGWLAQAKKDKTWLVLVYHRVADDPGPYDTKIADFKAQMAALKASGIPVKTMAAALTTVKSQL
jgi:peptidoglycan/xylan/chitin deacetylase (PgdA/CDA1 family)